MSADTGYEMSATDAKATIWLFLSALDQTDARADNKREFPFSTIVTDKELYFRIYGSGLKTTAPKFAATMPAAGKFASGQSANGITEATGLSFQFEAAVYANKAPESSSTTGLMEFKFGNGVWGGYCCATGTACSTCDYTAGYLKLFATATAKVIANSW
jgi:hypothetical protein